MKRCTLSISLPPVLLEDDVIAPNAMVDLTKSRGGCLFIVCSFGKG